MSLYFSTKWLFHWVFLIRLDPVVWQMRAWKTLCILCDHFVCVNDIYCWFVHGQLIGVNQQKISLCLFCWLCSATFGELKREHLLSPWRSSPHWNCSSEKPEWKSFYSIRRSHPIEAALLRSQHNGTGTRCPSLFLLIKHLSGLMTL